MDAKDHSRPSDRVNYLKRKRRASPDKERIKKHKPDEYSSSQKKSRETKNEEKPKTLHAVYEMKGKFMWRTYWNNLSGMYRYPTGIELSIQ